MSLVQALTVTHRSAVSPYVFTLPAPTGLSFNTGRTSITDQWSGATATVYGRDPSTITTPPAVGDAVQIKWGLTEFFYGVVQDWRVIYGLTTAYDTWELSLESGWGAAGRKTGNVTVTAGQSTYALAAALSSASSTLITPSTLDTLAAWGCTVSAVNITGQLAEVGTVLMETEQGAVRDWGQMSGGSPSQPSAYSMVYGRNSTQLYSNIGTFSDAGTGGTYKYDSIEFLSAAYNLGTKVTVQAAGFADQTAGTGDYTQTFSTVNGSATEALDLAGYLNAQLSLNSAVPFALSTSGSLVGNNPVTLFSPQNIKNAVTVVFRGNTYQCVIEGITFSANASDWTGSMTFSSSLQNAFLRLDNTTYGTLDNNRLGF